MQEVQFFCMKNMIGPEGLGTRLLEGLGTRLANKYLLKLNNEAELYHA